MKANLYMQFIVPDDYKVGDCQNCPLACKTYFENRYIEENLTCKVGFTSMTCPVFLNSRDMQNADMKGGAK